MTSTGEMRSAHKLRIGSVATIIPKRRLATDQIYDFRAAQNDARVCKDIPEAACHHQPCNFVALSNTVIGIAMLGVGLIGVVGDRLDAEVVIRRSGDNCVGINVFCSRR